MLGGRAPLFPSGPGGCRQRGPSPLMLAVVTWWRCVFGGPHPRDSFPCPRCPPWKGVAVHSPHLRSWEEGSAPRTEQPRRQRGSLLRRRRRNRVCVSVRDRIVYGGQSGRVRVSCTPWATSQCDLTLAGTDPALATGRSFRWLLCPSDTPIKVALYRV